MQDFIVLGIIPGTEYQTTFTFWVAVSAVIIAIPLLIRLWRKRFVLIALVLSAYVAWQISRRQLQA